MLREQVRKALRLPVFCLPCSPLQGHIAEASPTTTTVNL